jgi:hypothetical protein
VTDDATLPKDSERRLIILALWRDMACECPRRRFQCLRCELLGILRQIWADDYRQVKEIRFMDSGEVLP